ncbi:hypothetical protein SO802_006077 [Lithocarpus litseifolius]|uniref:CCHC-type domain-containing protein n=1 Tax=Lithocarpus litseifolius TaxID=425828 RepID=A0AAW2DLF9_9ROSI
MFFLTPLHFVPHTLNNPIPLMLSKRYDKQKSGKGKCFNYGKPGHFSKDCKQKPGKLKNKLKMLNINDNDQEELFRILESNNSSDSLEDDFSSSSDSCYQSDDDSSGSPIVKLGCRDSCCNVIKTVNVLTKSEENESLLIKLISQIENPELQKEYLDKFKKNLTGNENDKKLKPTISFEETLERFNKTKSKELTVNELQHEITAPDNEQDELKDGDESSQQALLSDKEKKNKEKAPAQGYPQDKRLPAGQPFVMHEGVSSGVKPSRSTSVQEFVPVEFHNGVYSELPKFVKFILDNLQAAFIQKNKNLFKKTLQALEIHLVNLTAQNEVYADHYANLVSENETLKSHLLNYPNVTNEPYTSQLFGKEEIHSMDKKTIMSTDYARLSLKTQSLLRSAVANLPTEIQSSILESKAMFGSFDLWYKYFKKLVTATIPDLDELDDGDNVFIQLDWEEHFGSSLRVYEKKHPFPGLLINYEDGEDEDDRDLDWLSQMFEYGFIRFLKLTSHGQISQFPQIIQNAVSQIKSPNVSIRCWSTLPKWERDNWMNVQPSKHLVLINGYTHQGQWFEGDSRLSFRDPYALAKCWRSYFNNQILEVTQDLWKDYHFIGSTDRISVFGRRPYDIAIRNLRRIGHADPREFLTGENPKYEPILYCGLCN